jgi:hypothetical protein
MAAKAATSTIPIVFNLGAGTSTQARCVRSPLTEVMVCPGGFGKAPGAGPILPVPQLAMPLPLVTRPHLQRVQSREGDVTGRDTVETGGRIKDAPAFTVEDLRVRERQLGHPPIGGPSSARWPSSRASGPQIESEDSRSCGSTTVSSAVAARAPAGNCSTVARWPSHKRVTSTSCPSGNSSAS